MGRYITKEEAYKAVNAAGHRVTDDDSSDFGRTLIHCFAGPFGADWDKDKVLEFVAKGTEFAWVDHMLKHNLAVGDGEKVRYFDIREA